MTLSNLRQVMYPPEFRISEPPWSAGDAGMLERIARQLASLDRSSRAQSSTPPVANALLAEIATGLWRLRQKMTQPGTAKPLEEMRRAYRHFESVWDALEREGVKIYDHTGENFDAGKSLKVLTYQPAAGLVREIITETVKPTVYIRDELVQMGEVIVGTPEN